MSTLIQRLFLIYFRRPLGVLFSILGALIAFVLYIVFLHDTIASGWESTPVTTADLDLWLIGGIMATSGVSVAFETSDWLTRDRENHFLDDFTVAGMSQHRLVFSYVVAAFFLSVVVQLLVGTVVASYFVMVGELSLRPSLSTLLTVVGIAFVNSASCAPLSVLLHLGLRHQSFLTSVHTIFGTLVGFLVGVYVPIGVLPQSGQLLIKIFPGAYAASLLRRTLLHSTLSGLPAPFDETFSAQMGLGYDWGFFTTTEGIEFGLLTATSLLGLLLVLAAKKAIRQGR